MMLDREDALDNLANYRSKNHLKSILSKFLELKKMATKGNQTAHCIVMDLEMTIFNKNILTEKQRKTIWMKFIQKETNQYIAEQMNISETAVRKHIEGGIKRIQKSLCGS